MGELGQRMGSREFGLWLAWRAEESIGPRDDAHRWAVMMAALFNGPLIRKDRRNWRPADFVTPTWVEPAKPVKATPQASLDMLKGMAATMARAVRSKPKR